MSYKVEKLPTAPAHIGEGPHWDIETQSLYFIDAYRGMIRRYSYDEKREYAAKVGKENVVSFIIPVDGARNKFAVGVGRRVAIVAWDGKSPTAEVERIAFEVETDNKYQLNRFNDAKADPKGRLFAGTMREIDGDLFGYRLGALYSVGEGLTVTKLRSNIGLSNGMTWNEAKEKMYYIDSTDLNVREFRYNFEEGKILDDGCITIDFSEDGKRPNFVPDGMTIDSDGFLYVAGFGASKVFKVNPDNGKVELSIELPCEQITSCAFGGPNLDILYVTSGYMGRDGKDKPAPAGATFQVTGLQAKGLPMAKVKL
ncbi:unnamed protein product [Hermetia illucens]|uniref:Regucalcin n=2 Tax=Hermetia illucens TaxID=343691 RepID=A0A7R8V2J7_HERIL|nr:unnamed protein product [Hermetia illucens]